MVFTLLVAAFLHDSPLIYLLIKHCCPFPVVHLHLLSPSWTVANPIRMVSGLYSSLERPLFVCYHLQTHPNHPKVPFWGWCWDLVLQPLSDLWAVSLRPCPSKSWNSGFFFPSQYLLLLSLELQMWLFFMLLYTSPINTLSLSKLQLPSAPVYFAYSLFCLPGHALCLPYSYQSIPWFMVPYLLWFYTTSPHTISPCCNYCDS